MIHVSLQTNGGDLLVGEIINVMFGRYKARMEEQSETMAVTDSTHLNGNDTLLERWFSHLRHLVFKFFLNIQRISTMKLLHD